MKNVKRWVARIDRATDAVALAPAAFSRGSLAAPAAVVKFVATFGGKELIDAVANSLIKQAYKHPRAANVGVVLEVKCRWGTVPYPSFGVAT